jgi:hypothetical protein
MLRRDAAALACVLFLLVFSYPWVTTWDVVLGLVGVFAAIGNAVQIVYDVKACRDGRRVRKESALNSVTDERSS